MAASHARASGTLARPSLSPAPDGDPLSEVLRTVKLRSAMYFLVGTRRPWGYALPAAAKLAPVVLPGARHVVSYHIVVEGAIWLLVEGAEPLRVGEGDVLVLAHSQPYVLVSRPGDPLGFDEAASLAFFREMAAGRLPFLVEEGDPGGELTRFVCGYLGSDLPPFGPLMASLPPYLRVGRAPGAGRDLLDGLVRLTLEEGAREPAPAGGSAVRLRLCELVFVEVLRRHLAAGPVRGPGWLAGLGDPGVGRALALLHARPAADWTLAWLAREAGMSRAALAGRFAERVGCPPMTYLTRWRMQLAGRMLADGEAKVAAVAEAVGYASEAAFSRAFRRETGRPPGGWRQEA